MGLDSFAVGYLGPETFIPLMSVIAAAVGVLLAFGRNAWAAISWVTRRFTRLVLRK